MSANASSTAVRVFTAKQGPRQSAEPAPGGTRRAPGHTAALACSGRGLGTALISSLKEQAGDAPLYLITISSRVQLYKRWVGRTACCRGSCVLNCLAQSARVQVSLCRCQGIAAAKALLSCCATRTGRLITGC